jgi:hypothetical protein
MSLQYVWRAAMLGRRAWVGVEGQWRTAGVDGGLGRADEPGGRHSGYAGQLVRYRMPDQSSVPLCCPLVLVALAASSQLCGVAHTPQSCSPQPSSSSLPPSLSPACLLIPQVALGWDEESRVQAAAGGASHRLAGSGGGGAAGAEETAGAAELAGGGGIVASKVGWTGPFWLHAVLQVGIRTATPVPVPGR